MIEVYNNLFVGAEQHEHAVRGQQGWFVIHACKEPYHRQALGYTSRAAAKDHPEYLIARRDGRLILNLVDVDNVDYISADIVDAALDAIQKNIGQHKILVHCNQGHSRSPSIAFLYLAKFTDLFAGQDIDAAWAAFKAIYQPFNPARGMADFIKINFSRYVADQS
jgi:hypothetical protein